MAIDKLEFLLDENGKIILTPLNTDAKELKGFLPKPKKKVTLEAMRQIIIKRGGGL